MDVSFNWIDNEKHLWFLTMTKGVNLVIITGNPLATRSSKNNAQGTYAYENLENEL